MTFLTQKYLKSVLNYNPDTGIFIWIMTRCRIKRDSVAGGDNGNGYVRISINYKQYYGHRLAWLYIYGKFPSTELDHINHNKSDNRINNLRECTRSQNVMNIKKRKNNTSGYTGVYWSIVAKKWQAYITINNKRIHLGYHVCRHSAAHAYNKRALKFFGEFACINKIKAKQ